MKAISLWQPWASLVSTGAKKIETRSWRTNYRGPLLICAAKKREVKALIYYLACWNFQGGLAPLKDMKLDMTFNSWAGIKTKDLPFGMALATVDLVDCLPVDEIPYGLIRPELCFGDYGPGRYGWFLENAKMIEPFPVTGRQGLFNVNHPNFKEAHPNEQTRSR